MMKQYLLTQKMLMLYIIKVKKQICNSLGLALRKINRTEEALKCYDQAIAVNSKYFEAFYNKGN
jgi:tetratricopeptide (TPR) repeat protein